MCECDSDQQATRRVKLCGWLFHGVSAAAIAVMVFPVAGYAFFPPFAGKAAGVAVFTAVCLERCWAMYFRQGVARACDGAGRDWTAVAVGYAYAATFGSAIAGFLLNGRFPPAGFLVAGACCYGAGVGLRYWAFHTLRLQWHVDVSDTKGERHLVRKGVYRFIRHPLYLGACLEAIGLPLFFGVRAALLIGAFVFIPFEVIRARYEEQFLCRLFGDEYLRYRKEVGGFIPFGRRRSRWP